MLWLHLLCFVLPCVLGQLQTKPEAPFAICASKKEEEEEEEECLSMAQ